MWNILLRILIAGIAGAAVAAIVIHINGKITKKKLKEELRKKNIEEALIKEIDDCDNVVKLKDMDSDKTLEVHGDDVSTDLREGDIIYV